MPLNLIVERRITANTVASARYVGSLGRYLLTVVEANPGDLGLCPSLSQPQDVAPGSPTCGPFGENQVYTLPDGAVVNGTRKLARFLNTIGTDAWFKNMGNSNYNALQPEFAGHAGKRSTSAGLLNRHRQFRPGTPRSLDFRFETFNTFNHAQFDGNGAVDGNVNDTTFGAVLKAAPSRISQAALKFLF
jgi:hypothetical protein